MYQDRRDLKEVERTIIKTYKKTIFSKFTKAIRDYELIYPKDKIAVAISGGKDSLLMAKLFQELQSYSKHPYELEFIVMDPGFKLEILDDIKKECQYLNIPIKIMKTDIFEITDKISKKYPCYICARMRRGALYSYAKELGCNKLALGHHFNDVIETTLMNILYTGSFKTMLPKLKSKNFKGIELIRPMYLIEERDISRFIKNVGIKPVNCECQLTKKEENSSRVKVKELIESIKEDIDVADKNIFKSATNVNAESILRWKKDGKYHSFLDEF